VRETCVVRENTYPDRDKDGQNNYGQSKSTTHINYLLSSSVLRNCGGIVSVIPAGEDFGADAAVDPAMDFSRTANPKASRRFERAGHHGIAFAMTGPPDVASGRERIG